MYCYINATLQNVWWTTVAAATFWWTQNFYLWDRGVWWWTIKSASANIYRAFVSTKAYSQAEVTADYALWNTTKSDPTIVAYYIPENLQYNTQYMTNPKALDQSPWSLSGASTVTADTTVAPDGTTTADTVAISWTATQWIEQPNTTITGAAIASKTFIVKAFVKVTAGTALFRLKMSHRAVADYFSSNQTATTDWQEFTFTKAFTASTSGTGIIGWVSNDTGATNPTLLVRNVRVYLVNETLRDESPNIWWFIWWKTQKVLSCRCKPWADSTSSSASQNLIRGGRWNMYITWTTNIPTKRIDTRIWAKTISWTALWNWFRGKVHLIGTVQYSDGVFVQKMYVNGVLQWTSTGSNDVPNTIIDSWNLSIARNTTTYYSWNIRDTRIYTFTWSFTDADALSIYNGGEPTSVWVTKHLHYKPLSWEIGTATSDLSTNLRDWTLNNWVTRTVV